MEQPNLFDIISAEKTIELELILLYALGEFQMRKKVLAERELPLDRLRGAFRRAAEAFGQDELNDEVIANELKKTGAKIVQVPSFVAKHPFRVTVSKELAERALKFYKKTVAEK